MVESVRKKLNPVPTDNPVVAVVGYTLIAICVAAIVVLLYIGRSDWLTWSLPFDELVRTFPAMLPRMLLFGAAFYGGLMVTGHLTRKTNSQAVFAIGISVTVILLLPSFGWLLLTRWGVQNMGAMIIYMGLVCMIPTYFSERWTRRMGFKGTLLQVKPTGINLGKNYYGPYEKDTDWRTKISVNAVAADHHEEEVELWWESISQIRCEKTPLGGRLWIIETTDGPYYVCPMGDPTKVQDAVKAIESYHKEHLVNG